MGKVAAICHFDGAIATRNLWRVQAGRAGQKSAALGLMVFRVCPLQSIVVRFLTPAAPEFEMTGWELCRGFEMTGSVLHRGLEIPQEERRDST
jgi:hypothetical protein